MKAVLLSAILITACASSDEPPATTTFVNKEQHYSLQVPRDWDVAEVRGLSQLSSPKLRKHAIVVRVADRPSDLGEGKPSTDEALIGVTERVLKDLPSAKLAGKSVVTASETPGVMFDLTFAPRNARGRYHRAHALLVGKKHLYHIIYSAPADETLQWDAFNAVVRSLSEEV